MPRIRIYFSKTGLACFISHIDLPVLFGRAARRAGLLPEQTQGFSPHPKLALCPPLPVGVVGLCEPADFWFTEWHADSFDRWRSVMPKGIELLSATLVDGVSLNKLCTAASYVIEPLNGATVEVAAVLTSALTEMGALLKIEVSGDEVLLSAENLERCGASYMIKSLVASSVLTGWSDISVVRTAVGSWSEEQKMVVSPDTGNLA